jgi:hypothetical protein
MILEDDMMVIKNLEETKEKDVSGVKKVRENRSNSDLPPIVVNVIIKGKGLKVDEHHKSSRANELFPLSEVWQLKRWKTG